MGAATNLAVGGRHEPRFPARVVVEITDWREETVSEKTFTENVSGHGARITSRWHWSPDEIVVIATRSGGMRVLARAVYCEALPGDEYVVGVHLLHSGTEWWKE